jgi:hypothetical protein
VLPILLASVLVASPLQTVAERSGFARTGRYAEVVDLCERFAATHPTQVRCETFGVTPERRPMLALVASADGVLSPEQARRAGRPVVMAQGGIHAGEIDGKDAGFLVLRQLLSDPEGLEVLGRVTFVFIPVLNVDGHERFGPQQRPNQRGPEETGWRVTARNLNLNRDYVKADTAEMRHLLRYLGAWDPILYLDLHATNGAQFQHDVAVMLEPLAAGPAALTAEARAVRERVLSSLTEQGHQPLSFYPSFVKHDDPRSGVVAGVSSPRFSHAYRAAKNRYAVLVETHAWKPYPLRVKATVNVLHAFLREAAARGPHWLRLAAQADAADAEGAVGDPLTLTFAPAGEPRMIDFLGYAFTHLPSPVSGAPVVHYDESKPELWRIPLTEGVKPARTAPAPAAWVVPAGWAEQVEPLLRLHGFRYDVLLRPREATLSRFRATATKFRDTPYEGRQTLEVQGDWAPAKVTLREGSLVVPAAQPGRRLLGQLFEPVAPDSLLAWGFFNAAFEQKEYLEDYVIEPFARALLAKDPAVKKAFEARLKDEAFAKDPAARLRFFAERHPAWDAQLDVYPVYRQEAR